MFASRKNQENHETKTTDTKMLSFKLIYKHKSGSPYRKRPLPPNPIRTLSEILQLLRVTRGVHSMSNAKSQQNHNIPHKSTTISKIHHLNISFQR